MAWAEHRSERPEIQKCLFAALLEIGRFYEHSRRKPEALYGSVKMWATRTVGASQSRAAQLSG